MKAFSILNDLTHTAELHDAVRASYEEVYGEEWEERMLEQGRLLWMTRRIENGKPVLWEIGMEE